MPLPMKGDAALEQEGVLDYAQRLAHVHQLRTKQFFARVLLPRADMQGAFFIPNYFSDRAVAGCNGWSGYAQSFLAALQNMTGLRELEQGSMAHWKDLLDPRGYVAKTRRWCAICLRNDTESVGSVYYRLLWSFEQIKCCPVHETLLDDRCPSCGLDQPWINDQIVVGRCAHCTTSLSKGRIGHRRAEERHLDDARALAGMIAERIGARESASIGNFQLSIQRAADQLVGGSIFRLERLLGFSYMSLATNRRRSLSFFLEVVRRLGVSPSQFFARDTDFLSSVRLGGPPYRTFVRPCVLDISSAEAAIVAQLNRLAAHPSEVLSHASLAACTGITLGALRGRYPEAMRVLRHHNDAVRASKRNRQQAALKLSIEAKMRELVDSGVAITANSIAIALCAIGAHRRNPWVRKIAIAAVHEYVTSRRNQGEIA